MTPKRQFLFKLAIQIESAERAVCARPEDTEAPAFAQALQCLNKSLSRFPENHLFFLSVVRTGVAAVALSDGPASETTSITGLRPAIVTQATMQTHQ